MIRNLKVLLAAALALAAVGAFAASAHAADEFICGVSPCRGKVNKDGTGATAHQVFIIENTVPESVSITCEELRGTGELVSGTNFLLGWSRPTEEREAYRNCTANGSPGVVVHMNDCKYRFTAGAAGTTKEAEVHIECPVGESIEITIGATCIYRIGTQTVGGSAEKGGVGFHTSGEEITVETNIKRIAVTAAGSACPVIGTLTGRYTTGNALLTGENSSGVMTTASFA